MFQTKLAFVWVYKKWETKGSIVYPLNMPLYFLNFKVLPPPTTTTTLTTKGDRGACYSFSQLI